MEAQPTLYQPLLRIGVTGHRLTHSPAVDWARAAERISVALEQVPTAFARQLPSDQPATRVAIRIVSLLADGADQLVAVKARQLRSADVELHCILPFAADEYRDDFTDNAARKQFDELRAAAKTVFEFDGRRDPGGEGETYAYLAAGEAMVQNCDVVIAVWDGISNGKFGGTADIVEKAIASGLPVLWIPVVNDTEPQFIKMDRFRPLPYGSTIEILDAIAAAFCTRPIALWLDPADEAALSEPALPGEFLYDAVMHWAAEEDFQPPNPDPPETDEESASQLGDLFGRRYRSSFLLLYAFAVAAVGFASISTVLPDYLDSKGYEFGPTVATTLSVLELVMIASSVALFWLARRSRWHLKWMHYRQVAEGLRQARLMLPLGRPPQWGAAKEGQLSSGMRYLKDLVRRRFPAAAVISRESLDGFAKDLGAELCGQRRYHADRHASFQKAHDLFEQLALYSFLLAAVGTIAHLAFHEFRFLILFSLVLPALAAALHGFDSQANLVLHAAQSRNVSQNLGRLKKELDRRMEAKAGGAELIRFAQESVTCLGAELSDWHTQTSAHPIVLP